MPQTIIFDFSEVQFWCHKSADMWKVCFLFQSSFLIEFPYYFWMAVRLFYLSKELAVSARDFIGAQVLFWKIIFKIIKLWWTPLSIHDIGEVGRAGGMIETEKWSDLLKITWWINDKAVDKCTLLIAYA